MKKEEARHAAMQENDSEITRKREINLNNEMESELEEGEIKSAHGSPQATSTASRAPAFGNSSFLVSRPLGCGSGLLSATVVDWGQEVSGVLPVGTSRLWQVEARSSLIREGDEDSEEDYDY